MIVPLLLSGAARAGIGVISPQEASELIKSGSSVVLDTRGGYKDYFRGHIPSAQHLNFDTLRGTDAGVPVQYLPADITEPLLVRAGATAGKTH
ncbi:MAG: sulfurtransferase, partial [Verrucomicrobiaceae bacterium]